MVAAIILLGAMGLLGAFDTLYFHEWRARLPAGGETTRPELLLHALRDFIYGILFWVLPSFAMQGAWGAGLIFLLLLEILITLSDFVIEDTVRISKGGVYRGERVTHSIMGIVYGAMLAQLLPQVFGWLTMPTRFARAYFLPGHAVTIFHLLALGVTASGLRDCAAALELRGSQWPWGAEATATEIGVRQKRR